MGTARRRFINRRRIKATWVRYRYGTLPRELKIKKCAAKSHLTGDAQRNGWISSSLLAKSVNLSKSAAAMASVVEQSMQELTLDKVDAAVASKVTELHVYGTTAADNAEAVKAVAQPGTPAGKQAAAALADTGEKAKKARRRRGKKPAPGKENVAPKDVAAGPVDVAAVLKARAAAKKKGSKPVSAAAQAALANAKARPAQKKKAPKGRQVADPGCNGY